MQLGFYTDTHVAKQIALQLRQKNVDIVRCEEVGMAEADDEAHLSYATAHGRIIITFDKGFRDRGFLWLSEGKQHTGIFVCKDHLQGSGGIGTIVNECLFYHTAVQMGAAKVEEFQNQVIDIE
ncbi:MAG: DUF5615 family PIN-like protein [Aggregatilineales bacterium]